MSRQRRTPDREAGVAPSPRLLARFVGDPGDPRRVDAQRAAVVFAGVEISCSDMTEVPEHVYRALQGHSHFETQEATNGR